MTPPKTLDTEGKRVWTRFRKLLEARGVWDDASPELLTQCVACLQEAREARERIAERVKHEGSEARWTKGSRGQLVLHPDVDLIRHSLADALRIGDALLLTPASARRAGVVADTTVENPFAAYIPDELAPRRRRTAT